MDLADEIAYCAHDLEDALSLSYFNIEEFLFELKIGSIDNFEIFDKWVSEARDFAFKSSNYTSSEEFAFIFRKELTSIIVDRLARDIDVIQVANDFKEKTGTENKFELGFLNFSSLVKSLKDKTFDSVNRTPGVQMYEKLGGKVITGLMNALIDEKYNKDQLLLPVEFRNTEDINRGVSDYISGMMDKFAINLYKKIHGERSLDNTRI